MRLMIGILVIGMMVSLGVWKVNEKMKKWQEEQRQMVDGEARGEVK